MASYPLRGLRVRLSLAVAASCALLLGAGATVLYAVLETHWRAEVDQSLDHSVDAARALFSTELAEYGTPTATVVHIVSELVFGDRSIVAVDSVGRRLAQSRPLAESPDLWRADLPKIGDGHVTVVTPQGESRTAAAPLTKGFSLVIGLTLEPLHARLRDLRFTLAAGLLVSLLAGIAVSWIVAGRVLTPVTEMATAADRVSDDLARGQRPALVLSPSATPNDEVGRLQTAFTALIARVEVAFQQERDQATRQRQFFADAAHELRTPVAILSNQLDAARNDPAIVTDQREVLDRLARETRHLGRLVADLLLLARGETPKDLETAGVIYLDDVASSAMVRAGRHPAAEGRRIAVDRFEAAPVKGDPTLLERAILALVENALIHAPESPIEVSVGNGGTSWVRVTDWGPAIPADAEERIFERFVRLRKDVPGSGLGLAIVQRIAAIHGGSLRLEQASSPTRKSFLIELPIATP